METNNKYLHFVDYRTFVLWDIKRYSMTQFSSSYPIVRLGYYIQEEGAKYKISDPTKTYGILGVNNQTGIFDAYLEKGSKIKQKYKKIQVGWIAYNPYRVNVGSIGMRTDKQEYEYISPAYVVFSCKNGLLPEYLYRLMKTDLFNKIIRENTTGSVRQNLNYSVLSNLQIPLPSLEEQNEIVHKYFKKIKQAEEKETEAKKVENTARKWIMDNLGISINNEVKNHYRLQFVRYKSLEKWSIDEIKRYNKYSFDNANYEVIKLSDIITSFEGGKTPSTLCKEYWGEDVNWVSAKDMKELYLLNVQDKLSQKGVDETKLKVYPKGTILGVFRSGILRHSFPVCITTNPVTINQDLKAFSINEEKAQKLYFLFYLNLLQDIVLNVAMKKGVTVESIDTDAFMEIPFICPPIEKQKEIVAHITNLRDEQKNLQQQASELRQQAQYQFEQAIFN